MVEHEIKLILLQSLKNLKKCMKNCTEYLTLQILDPNHALLMSTCRKGLNIPIESMI